MVRTLDKLPAEIEWPKPLEDLNGFDPQLFLVRPGLGRPMFMIHSLNATLAEVVSVFRHVRSRRPVIGINAADITSPRRVPHKRVEILASDYIRLMRSVQPHGPYSVGGYSFGGVVAYEIARQLLAVGEAVDPVLLIDSGVNPRFLAVGPRMRQYARTAKRKLHAIRIASASLRLRQIRKETSIFLQFCVELFCPPMLRRPSWDARQLPPEIARARCNLEFAMSAYKPRAFGGDVLYIQTSHAKMPEVAAHWRSVVGGRFCVQNIAGSHTSIVREDAPALARTLDSYLSLDRRDLSRQSPETA